MVGAEEGVEGVARGEVEVEGGAVVVGGCG